MIKWWKWIKQKA